MNLAERDRILARYRQRAVHFDAIAAGRKTATAEDGPPPAASRRNPSDREIAVLQLVSQGLINREIGRRLYISEETVKSHIRQIFAKLPAGSRAHAVAVGFRQGLLA
jgi:LuxR family maltose regulon positive regulatory protein